MPRSLPRVSPGGLHIVQAAPSFLIPNGTIIHKNNTATEGNCNKGSIKLGLLSTSSVPVVATVGCWAVLTFLISESTSLSGWGELLPFSYFFCSPAWITALFAAAWLAFNAASTVILPANAPATF
jgi:hypothetical protein